VTSKYDDFWRGHVDELAAAIESAAAGRTAQLDVVGLQRLGQRSSWYGSAVVRGREHQAAMAHMASLAGLVVGAGLCDQWPEVEFRFAVNQSGSLTVSTTATPRGTPRRNAARSARPASPPTASTAAEEPTLDPTVACAQVHRLLETLPLLEAPEELAFANGLYFFYETGETSGHAQRGRIVRVGNHPRAADRLKARLSEHFRTRKGAKNGSAFRRYLGGALMRQDDPGSSCLLPRPGAGHWERQGLPECHRCAGYEERVTAYLRRSFRFRCVRIDDMDERNRFEGRLVATLAACPVCRPSLSWLGRHTYSPVVHASGLWNSDFVGGPQLDQRDLQRFEDLVVATGRHTVLESHDVVDLSDTLLIIPCCQSKHGAGGLDLPTTSVADFLGSSALEMLETGRAAAFERPGTRIDRTSTAYPALQLYTGQPYETPGLRGALVSLIRSGLHCVIVSGGYGLVRPEEPIHYYEASIQRTSSVWRRRVPALLADYVERQRISRSFGAFSRQYASVVPLRLTGDDWRAVPRFSRGDEGSAYHEVPRRVGSALMRLIEAQFVPERATEDAAPWEAST